VSYFEPVGDESRWLKIYRLLQGKQVGDVLTYEEMGEVLGLDPKDRQMLRRALRRAKAEFLNVESHALEADPNVGYRVVAPPEHLGIARGYQRRSRRALVRGRDLVIHVDFNGMETTLRRNFDSMVVSFNAQESFWRREELRQRRLAQALSAAVVKPSLSESEVVEAPGRVERLESGGA